MSHQEISHTTVSQLPSKKKHTHKKNLKTQPCRETFLQWDHKDVQSQPGKVPMSNAAAGYDVTPPRKKTQVDSG